MLSFFPRGVLDEILNLIESVSEGFPSFSPRSNQLNYDVSYKWLDTITESKLEVQPCKRKPEKQRKNV